MPSFKDSGYLHLAVALAQSAALTAAIGVVFSFSETLSVWLVILGGLALGIPALMSIQHSGIKFLGARKLVSARRYSALNVNDIDAQYELGILEATRGRMDAARQAFDAALALRPTHAPSLVGHGHLAAETGDLPMALRYFQQAAGVDAGLFSAHFGIGTVHQAREQYARSISAFEKALEIEPLDGATLAEVARNHLALGDSERAQQFLLQAEETGHRDSDLARSIEEHGDS